MVKKSERALAYVPYSKLKLGGGAAVCGTVTELGPVMEITLRASGKKERVQNGKMQFEGDEMPIALYDGQIGQVKVGDLISIDNAWVKDVGGMKVISTGRIGNIRVMKKNKPRKIV